MKRTLLFIMMCLAPSFAQSAALLAGIRTAGKAAVVFTERALMTAGTLFAGYVGFTALPNTSSLPEMPAPQTQIPLPSVAADLAAEQATQAAQKILAEKILAEKAATLAAEQAAQAAEKLLAEEAAKKAAAVAAATTANSSLFNVDCSLEGAFKVLKSGADKCAKLALPSPAYDFLDKNPIVTKAIVAYIIVGQIYFHVWKRIQHSNLITETAKLQRCQLILNCDLRNVPVEAKNVKSPILDAIFLPHLLFNEAVGATVRYIKELGQIISKRLFGS